MCCASTSVMVAVVQCASSVGGSPRLPTLRTPPFFWATASDALPATSAVDTSADSTARTISLDGMRYLPVVSEPNLSHAQRPAVGQLGGAGLSRRQPWCEVFSSSRAPTFSRETQALTRAFVTPPTRSRYQLQRITPRRDTRGPSGSRW